jgi:hypothetical protein
MNMEILDNCSARKFTMRCLILFITIISLLSFCNSQTRWKQRQFILGTFNDPPYHYSQKSLTDDSANFQLAKDANFNLLTGTQGEGAIDHSFEGMQWALKLAQRVGLFYLVSDNRIYEAYNHEWNLPVVRSLVAQYTQLPRDCEKAFYGIMLCDEPHYSLDHINKVYPLKWSLEAAFPEKLIFLNLAPSYSADQNWGGFEGGNRNGILDENEKIQYEKYLSMYIDSLRPAVVSYDHYPFFRTGDIRRDYFYNLRIIRQKSGDKPFWACPMTVDHFRYVDPKEAHLRFMYFCPIAYGAKGLIAFTYWPPSENRYRSSLFDRQGRKTEKYDIVRKLNLYVSKVLEPVIMNVPHVALYHASSYPNNQLFLEDSLKANSQIVASISSEKILVGVFKNQKKTFLFVVNKSLDTVSNVQIGIKDVVRSVYYAPRIIDFDQSTSMQYKRVNTNVSEVKTMSSFSIPQMEGGEGRLIQVR